MLDTDDTDDLATDPTLVSDDSGGAHETPASDAPDPDAGSSDDAPSGPPRDPAGRFAPKTAPPATAPDGAPASDDPDAPAATPAPELAAPLPASDAPPEAPAGRPYAFPHRGQAYAVEGAVEKPDGSLVIPASARSRVDLLLSRGREHEVFGPQLVQKTREEVQQWKARAEARDLSVEAFSKLFADNPDPETFLSRAFEFYQSMPQLKEEQLRQRIAELEKGGAPAVEATPADGGGYTPEQLQQGIVEETGSALVAMREQLPEFKDFTDDELRALHGQLVKRAGLFVRLATDADKARWGVEVGEPVNDTDALVAEAKLLAAPTIQQKARTAAKAKADAAAAAATKKNGAVLTAPKLEPTPRPGVEMAGASGVPKFKTREDYEAWLNE